ncbi:hypothetical protein BYT27DRAFT_7193199 [Phlegmacium glaucopus]|nr:hypothetical protein BYT27DRAFT_7193199 [Phlegmacium glaucopus]
MVDENQFRRTWFTVAVESSVTVAKTSCDYRYYSSFFLSPDILDITRFLLIHLGQV